MGMTNTKTSWINKVKTIQQVNRELVMRKLGISEEDYHDMWLDAGIHYLTDVIEVGEWKPEFMNARIFWKWWLNHWQRWDARFLEYTKEVPKDQWAKLYDDVHDPLHADFKPHAVVLEDIFHKEVVIPMTKGQYEKA
ncbi:hypothetical protein [Sphingobacterium faecium]|uniref:hypothetical protein n=1 Tax=Sphingobacterium faecium TaxID=34087 RepID=UPI002479FA7E|nr:hypothetical protein [Sphingobacterium faecium]WGQ12961.1 hypothetical protein QG727_13090 [Sphingobacterium faecium]